MTLRMGLIDKIHAVERFSFEAEPRKDRERRRWLSGELLVSANTYSVRFPSTTWCRSDVLCCYTTEIVVGV
jgi:hypothetical protein